MLILMSFYSFQVLHLTTYICGANSGAAHHICQCLEITNWESLDRESGTKRKTKITKMTQEEIENLNRNMTNEYIELVIFLNIHK
jgi:hypothetical protein